MEILWINSARGSTCNINTVYFGIFEKAYDTETWKENSQILKLCTRFRCEMNSA
jgi:hypothetical protein